MPDPNQNKRRHEETDANESKDTTEKPLSKRIRIAKKRLDRAQAEATATLESAGDEIAELKKKLDGKTHELKTFQKAYEILISQNVDLNHKVNVLESDNESRKLNQMVLRGDLTKANIKSADLVKESNAQKKELATHATTNSSLKAAEMVLRGDLDKSGTRVAELKKVRDSLRNKISRLEGKDREQKEKLELRDSMIRGLEYEKDGLYIRIVELEGEVTGEKKAVIAVRGDLERNKAKVDELVSENVGLMERASRLERELAEEKVMRSELTSMNTELLREVSHLESALAEEKAMGSPEKDAAKELENIKKQWAGLGKLIDASEAARNASVSIQTSTVGSDSPQHAENIGDTGAGIEEAQEEVVTVKNEERVDGVSMTEQEGIPGACGYEVQGEVIVIKDEE